MFASATLRAFARYAPLIAEHSITHRHTKSTLTPSATTAYHIMVPGSATIPNCKPNLYTPSLAELMTPLGSPNASGAAGRRALVGHSALLLFGRVHR